jgi:uncharacterized protein YkwD
MKILIILLLFLNLFASSLLLKSYFIKPQKVSITTSYKFDEKQVKYLLQKRQLSLKNPLYIESQFLCDVASIRLEEVQKNWSHDGFSANRFCPKDCTIGENLAHGYSTESLVIKAWENSPSHLYQLNYPYKYFCVKAKNNYTVLTLGNY